MRSQRRYPRSSTGRTVRGFGLIELMVAVVISLMVVLAISSLFLVQKRSYATQDDFSRMQESARTMTETLSHALRNAGYWDAELLTTFGTDPILDGANGSGSGVAASDSLTVRFYGSSAKPDDPAVQMADWGPDGSVVDCQGNPRKHDELVTETFSIQTGKPGDELDRPWLVCVLAAGNDADKQWLFADVDSMQLLYGEDTDGDGSINRLRPAGTVNMNNVKSVMLSFVMRTPTANHPTAANTVFNHFGSAYAPENVAPGDDVGSVFVPADDQRMRRQFAFSIGVRNRLN